MSANKVIPENLTVARIDFEKFTSVNRACVQLQSSVWRAVIGRGLRL